MSNRVAMITGASRGIGAATAKAFAEAGWDVVLAARSEEDLEQVRGDAASCGASALAVPTDLTEPEQIDALFDKAVSHFGRLDALVNNAVRSGGVDFLVMPHEEWHAYLAVNLHAPVFCAQLAARQMVKQQSGVIINVSSINEKQSIGNNPAYVVAKGGLQVLTRELAVRLGSAGIRALTVTPGHIETDISGQWAKDLQPWLDHCLDMTPLARGGQPEEVADLIVFLASDKAAFITGTEIVIDGGRLAAIYPESLRRTLF